MSYDLLRVLKSKTEIIKKFLEFRVIQFADIKKKNKWSFGISPNNNRRIIASLSLFLSSKLRTDMEAHYLNTPTAPTLPT